MHDYNRKSGDWFRHNSDSKRDIRKNRISSNHNNSHITSKKIQTSQRSSRTGHPSNRKPTDKLAL